MNSIARFVRLTAVALMFCGSAYAADVPQFEVLRYQVSGNTVVSPVEADQALAAFIGKDKNFGDLQQAVEALEQAYHAKGFHAVKVMLPEQELKGGVVRLEVAEVRVGTVTVEGNNFFDKDNIRRSVPRLQEGTFPNLDRISMDIKVANENPAKKVQMVLESGGNETVNAKLKVSDEKPWKLGTTLDDTGTKQSGRLRLSVMGQYANLFNLDHLASFQYTMSPEHQEKVNIYSGGYRIPLYNLGDSIDFYGGYSDVDSGTVVSGLSNLDISGKGAFAGARYNQNLQRVSSYEHRFIYGIDYRRFENNIGFAGIQLGTTTKATPVSAGYSGTYTFTGGGMADGWLSLSQNVSLDSKDSNAYSATRTGSRPNFFVIRGGSSATCPLPTDFQLRYTFNGQYTWQPLIPGEQFGMGGQGSVRGFDEREFSDDYGLAGSVELYSPDVAKLANVKNTQLRVLGFFDAGHLERNKPELKEVDSRLAASAGTGIRFAYNNYLSASTDFAVVIDSVTHRVGEPGYHAEQHPSTRWHFKVQLTF